MGSDKVRLDQLLVDRGDFQTKSSAQSAILAGEIKLKDQVIAKPGYKVHPDAVPSIKSKPKYVSRGGLKLEKALLEFEINCHDKNCVDIGSSTGGFTDCLLKHGAKQVTAVDVGTNQLVYSLRQDLRVTTHEKTHAKDLKPEHFLYPIDLVVMDVSFISVRKIFEPIIHVIGEKAEWVILIKPQFEGERAYVEKGGIVSDLKKHKIILEEVLAYFDAMPVCPQGLIQSPIRGAKGNIEYLLYLKGNQKNVDLLKEIPNLIDRFKNQTR